MERGRVWPVGLESIQEDCLFNDFSSDISDDEARIEVVRQGFVFFFIFIGPESDHWECLSLTQSLTNSLLFSKLD